MHGLGVGKETEPKTHVEEKYDTSPRDESSRKKEMHGLGVDKETEPKTHVEETYDTSPRDESSHRKENKEKHDTLPRDDSYSNHGKENKERHDTPHYNKSGSKTDVSKRKIAERLAQKACRFTLNNINLQTIAENTPDIVEFHSELKKAVDNLTTVEVQSIIKNWESQNWPSYEMLTVTSDLDSNDEKITEDIDIKPVIFVMIKGAMLKTLVDSGCEKSVIN